MRVTANLIADLLREFDDAEIRLHGFPALRKFLFRLFIVDRRWNDHVLSRRPIRRGRDRVFGGKLAGIEQPKDFVEIPAAGRRVGHHGFDLLIRSDQIQRADRGVRSICRKHVVEFRDLQVSVANHRKADGGSLRFLDVTSPLRIVFGGIDAESDKLRIAALKLRFHFGEGSDLGGAYWAKGFSMREQNGPTVSEPFMKIDFSLSGLRREVGSFRVDS